MNSILFYTGTSPYANKRFGGAETSMRLLAEKLVENGQSVVFVSNTDDQRLKTISKKRINNVIVYTIAKSIYPLSKVNRLRKWVKQKNNRVHNNHVEQICIEHQVNLVYTYYELDACLYFIKLKQKLDFKYVVRVAGMHWAEKIRRRPNRKELYQKIFNQADALNFISKGLVRLFNQKLESLQMNILPKNSFVLDIGVEINLLNPNFRKNNLENKRFTVLMATRFSNTQKRQDILVEAVGLLPSSLPIKVFLVGDGPKRENIKRQIEELNLQDKFEVIPFMKQEQLWELMGNVDLLCHACDYEGLSKIIIESMGMGLPVLASDVLPLNMYIKDGKNSFLAQNESKSWAEKLNEIYEEKKQMKAVGEKAKLFIKNEYNANKNVLKYIEVFQNL